MNEWKELIEEVMGDAKIAHIDNSSVFVERGPAFIVVEHQDHGGLQMQLRESFDHADIVVSEDLVAHGKIVSKLVSSNKEYVKEALTNFIEKLEKRCP